MKDFLAGKLHKHATMMKAAVISFILMAVAVVTICYVTSANVIATDFELYVQTDKAARRTSDKFVSVTVDTANIVNHWKYFNPDDPVAVKLAQALTPAYLRVGGTSADSLIFVGQDHEQGVIHNSTFTVADWDKLNRFSHRSNLSLIFGLNSLYRPGLSWDPTNAIELMKYSAQKGYVLDLELGNEPNTYDAKYERTVDPQQLGRDFGTLRSIMDSMPSFRTSILMGPDVTQDVSPTAKLFLENFMKTGSKFIHAMTFHQYYMNGHTAKPEDFIDTTKLDSFKEYLINGQQFISNFSQGTQKFWLGETSSAYDSGAPGLSDTFLAGFMWLDKLGLSALYGADVVIRQEFVGGNYGLVKYSHGVYTPNPDYWLTVLFKNLVGETVLETQGLDEKLRIYSHCTNTRSGYGPGSVTFYMMNLYNTTKTVSFSQFTGQELHLYILSSGDQHSLVSRSVLLNGKPLELSSGQLPPLPPIVQNSTTINVASFTMGFVVVPEADAAACS